jgi:hypothetical protein
VDLQSQVGHKRQSFSLKDMLRGQGLQLTSGSRLRGYFLLGYVDG